MIDVYYIQSINARTKEARVYSSMNTRPLDPNEKVLIEYSKYKTELEKRMALEKKLASRRSEEPWGMVCLIIGMALLIGFFIGLSV